MQHIAFIGLGNMGGPMALNLVRAGYRLSVFDLVPSAVQTLVEAGATLTSAFIQQHLVDEYIHYLAPTLLGTSARPMFQADLQSLHQQYRFHIQEMTQVGGDIRLNLIPVQE